MRVGHTVMRLLLIDAWELVASAILQKVRSQNSQHDFPVHSDAAVNPQYSGGGRRAVRFGKKVARPAAIGWGVKQAGGIVQSVIGDAWRIIDCPRSESNFKAIRKRELAGTLGFSLTN